MSKISFKNLDQARRMLKLGEKATLAEIKKAYRRLSKKWHPDCCKESDRELCHEKMKELNNAHKVILKYLEKYSYSFKEEKAIEDNPEERWKKQFGNDSHWGNGWQEHPKYYGKNKSRTI